MNYPLLLKYHTDLTKYRASSYGKMENVLDFCEKNNLIILEPAFIKNVD